MQTRIKQLREILSPADMRLPAVRALYELTLARSERIPWSWIERGLGRRYVGRRWRLFVAERERLRGYCYGAWLGGYGGYVSYVGVAPEARGQGVGHRLYYAAFRRFRRDARMHGEALPFVAWESRRPAADDGPAVHANWRARLRLFEKVGGQWLSGANWTVPDYMDDSRPPIELEVFVRPIDRVEYSSAALRDVLDGLSSRVYRLPPSDSPVGDLQLRPIQDLSVRSS
ncbi:MAG: GNAT family N-acetyltransferase [Gemmataceae bacterium]